MSSNINNFSSTMIPTIPQQATFFYCGKWSMPMDTMLLSYVVKLHAVGQSSGMELPQTVIDEVRMVLNIRFGMALTSWDVVVRLETLKVRYKTFKELVHTPDVRWEQDDHVVAAEDQTWRIILQSNPYVGAYYYRDEPKFNLLASLFGLDDVKMENEHDVINISDTTELLGTEVIVLTDSSIPLAMNQSPPMSSPDDHHECDASCLTIEQC